MSTEQWVVMAILAGFALICLAVILFAWTAVIEQRREDIRRSKLTPFQRSMEDVSLAFTNMAREASKFVVAFGGLASVVMSSLEGVEARNSPKHTAFDDEEPGADRV